MPLTLNHNHLRQLIDIPFPTPAPHELRRQEKVFFIGGNLPVYETLETMFASYCQESTDLFHVTFSGRDDLKRNLELVSQIKKNFSVRLMGRISYEISPELAEQSYLAGLDMLDLPHPPVAGSGNNAGETITNRLPLLRQVVGIFPRWSVISSLPTGHLPGRELQNAIDILLGNGVIPLPSMNQGQPSGQPGIEAIFNHVLKAWQKHKVQINALLPIIRLVTPLESSRTDGLIRTVFKRIQDRHQLATSDLRRHLRTSEAEASFESAGL